MCIRDSICKLLHLYQMIGWYKCASLLMWFVIAYCNKIFIFAVLERWLIHFTETECSFVYLIFEEITEKSALKRGTPHSTAKNHTAYYCAVTWVNNGWVLVLFFSVGASCPISWYFYNNSCYYPAPWSKRATQANARASCQAMGGDLVSISDQDEMDFVLRISYKLTYPSSCILILHIFFIWCTCCHKF